MGIAMAVRNPTRSAGAPPERGSNRELATALIFLVPAAIDFLASSSTRRSRGFYLSLTDYSVLGRVGRRVGRLPQRADGSSDLRGGGDEGRRGPPGEGTHQERGQHDPGQSVQESYGLDREEVGQRGGRAPTTATAR